MTALTVVSRAARRSTRRVATAVVVTLEKMMEPNFISQK